MKSLTTVKTGLCCLLLTGMVTEAQARSSATSGRASIKPRTLKAPKAQRRFSSWVPAKAWQAVHKMAQKDINGLDIKVYKSGWSKQTSQGLVSSTGKGAWIVHAKLKAVPTNGTYKTKGTYLVQEISKGVFEATPLSSNGRGKHVSTFVPGDKGQIQAHPDGRIPHKVGHGVVFAGKGFSVGAQLGQILATKKTKYGSSMVFFGAEGNKGGIGAAAQAKLSREVLEYLSTASKNPTRGEVKSYVNVKFDRKREPVSPGWPGGGALK